MDFGWRNGLFRVAIYYCKLPKIAKMGGFCPALSLKNKKMADFCGFAGEKMVGGAVKMPVFFPGVGDKAVL